MNKGILEHLRSALFENKKLIAILIDPDYRNFGHLETLLAIANKKPIDLILVGGSLLGEGNMEESILFIRNKTKIPIVIFPGTTQQINNKADAILLLSLVSGRNPDFLIGKQVESSFRLKASHLEIIPTAYLLIESGKPTTASYISFTQPLPADKPMLSAATALAAEQLGMKLIYLDSGSGALQPVPSDLINAVKLQCTNPIIVGGGLKTKLDISKAFEAGATMVVIGTSLEQNPHLLNDII